MQDFAFLTFCYWKKKCPICLGVWHIAHVMLSLIDVSFYIDHQSLSMIKFEEFLKFSLVLIKPGSSGATVMKAA